jgi:hypothetical protein
MRIPRHGMHAALAPQKSGEGGKMKSVALLLVAPAVDAGSSTARWGMDGVAVVNGEEAGEIVAAKGVMLQYCSEMLNPNDLLHL